MNQVFNQINELLIYLNSLSTDQIENESIDIIFDSLEQGELFIQCHNLKLDEKQIKDIVDESSLNEIKTSDTETIIKFKYPKQKFEDVDVNSWAIEIKKLTEYFSVKTNVSINEELIELNKGASPLWRIDSSEAKFDDYIKFYKSKYTEAEEVPPWIYIKIYEPYKVEGIIFINQFNPYRVVGDKDKLNLLIEQAIVGDQDLTDWIPSFLNDIYGVLEIKDIKFSERNNLRNSKALKELSKELALNIAHSIRRLNKKSREEYETLWPSLSFFVKKACMYSPDFDSVMRPFVLFENHDRTLKTLDEFYGEDINKEDNFRTIAYYDKNNISDEVAQIIKEQNITALAIDNHIDPLYIQFEETSIFKGRKISSFVPVETLILNSGKTVDQKQEKEIENLFIKFYEEKFESKISPATGKLNISEKSYPNDDVEGFICVDEHSKRSFYNTRFTFGLETWPLDMTMVINSNNSKVQSVLQMSEQERTNFFELLYIKSSKHIWNTIPVPSVEEISVRSFDGSNS